MDRFYIGIDNGVTGSIAILCDDKSKYFFSPVPTKSQLSYTKSKKQNITRIDIVKLFEILNRVNENSIAIIERPFVNPMMFKASLSAVRCLEVFLIAFENRGIPYQYIDSKEWQKEFLPMGCKKEELKIASRDIGIRLFPTFKNEIEKQKDADSLLIAEYARRHNL